MSMFGHMGKPSPAEVRLAELRWFSSGRQGSRKPPTVKAQLEGQLSIYDDGDDGDEAA